MPSVKFRYFIKPIIIVNLVQGAKKLNIRIVNVFVIKKYGNKKFSVIHISSVFNFDES